MLKTRQNIVFLLLLIFDLFSNGLFAQSTHKSKEGSLSVTGEYLGHVVVAHTKNVEVFLDYESAAFTLILVPAELHTGIDSLDLQLQGLVAPLILKGKLSLGRVTTTTHVPQSFNFSGNNDFDNDFIRQRIRNYIGHCLKERQYAVDTLEPDLLVRVKWMAEARQIAMPDVTDRPFYYDRIYYDDPYAPRLPLRISKPAQLNYPNRFPITEGKQTYYHNGVEVIFVNNRTKEVVWNGFTSDDIYDPKTIDKELHPSIHAMMKRFSLKK